MKMQTSQRSLRIVEPSSERSTRPISLFRPSQLVASALLAFCYACGSGSTEGKQPAVSGAGNSSTSPGGSSNDSGGSGDVASGGSNTSAGAGNSGGKLGSSTEPPTVGACDNLPAPGKWEYIAPKNTETKQELGAINTQGLALDPFNAGTVWMGASSVYPKSAGGLYKSTDCGSTWTHVNTGNNGSKLDTAAMWSLAIDPVDKGTIYVVGVYGPGNLWKSTDGGVNFDPILPDGDFAKNFAGNSVASVTIDPTDHLHLVIAPHGNCEGPYAPICNGESTDGGKTWRLVKVPGTGWGEATGPFLLNGTSWISSTNGLWFTKDNGASWKNVKPSNINYITGGEFTHRPFRKSPLGNYYLATQQENGLITSTDGENWTYIKGTPNAQYQVGFAFGGGKLYLGDVVGGGVQVADESKPDTWTALPTPPAAYNGSTKGPIYLEYDEEHHILYSSNFEGGLWRIVTP